MNNTKNNGFSFLDFIVVKEAEVYDYHRLAGSYAVIKCDDKYLLCYNTLRKQWEIPAGRREEDETPKECAIRELYEETGQRVSGLEFKGLLKVKSLVSDEVKYNPVYFTTLVKLQPFLKNNETSEILLWDLKQEIGYIDEIDIKVFNYI
ncbi:NUDIX domain-containing protein [Oceanobacillus manasiensis]|uniref:NUDIX domain-containing protein n=1 Tax=Oceanobacillus manasiensis TaxID=586413 RepID=UPI0005A95A65|nr:NUDIX hydrolase [Oceanobacillus manasiensis]